MIDAGQALERLREGNQRFVSDQHTLGRHVDEARRMELTQGQAPFAVILGCSDSRVPVEVIFDQGLGDLFVIRVAGNVVAPSLVGSVEFAAHNFGTRLVVVLGHSNCGAVQTTLQELEQPSETRSPNLRELVDRVRPSVEALLSIEEMRNDRPRLIAHSVRDNVRASANHLRHGSAILERLIRDDGLMVVGAEYSLETGRVEFFDGVPETG